MNEELKKLLEEIKDSLPSRIPELSSIAIQLRDEFTEMYRNEVKVREIDLTVFKMPGFYITPEINQEFLDGFDKYLKSDKNYHLADYELDGVIVKEIKYKPYTCKFISSGKIVLENDLREYFDEEISMMRGRKGTIKTIDYYQKQGMIHPFVGNSCPTFWMSDNKEEIVVGTKYTEPEADEDYSDIPDMDGYTEWGYVCTDLWWYSLVDYEVFKLRSKLTEAEIDSNYTVLDLPAGEWKLEHYYGILDMEHGDDFYGRLTKIK